MHHPLSLHFLTTNVPNSNALTGEAEREGRLFTEKMASPPASSAVCSADVMAVFASWLLLGEAEQMPWSSVARCSSIKIWERGWAKGGGRNKNQLSWQCGLILTTSNLKLGSETRFPISRPSLRFEVCLYAACHTSDTPTPNSATAIVEVHPQKRL